MIFYIIRNYILHLYRNKLYTLITVSGFAISIMFVLLLGIYIRQELSVDHFHVHKDRIFRLVRDGGATFAPPIGDDIMNQHPEVETYTRLYNDTYSIKLPDGQQVQASSHMVDPAFFEIFSFPLIKGDPREVMAAKNSVVITSSFARNFFNDNPVGHVISLNDQDFMVTGIIEDIPDNSHISKCEIFLNFAVLFDIWGWPEGLTSYGNSSFGMYFLARVQTDLPSKAPQILEKFMKDYWLFSEGYSKTLYFEPLTDVYYSHEYGPGIRHNSKTSIVIFGSIAFLIMIIAIINYINLTIAQSGFRSKEFAIKKLMGSSKRAVFIQNISESVILASAATCLAVVLAYLAEHFFNNQMDSNLNLGRQFNLTFISFLILMGLMIGVVSGLFPALVTDKYQPLDIVKGALTRKTRNYYSRLLIAFQYSVAIVLVLSTWTISRQSSYMRNYDVGFDTDNIFRMENTIQPHQKETFRDQLLTIPGVTAVSFCMGTPVDGGNNQSFTYNDKPMSFQEFVVDSSFFELMGISISETQTAYSKDGWWINETAVRMLELGDNPASFKFHDSDVPVLGIIEDFNFEPLHRPVGPVMVRQLNEASYPWSILVKVEGHNPLETASQIKAVQSEFTGGVPMESAFVDDTLNQWYQKEFRQARLIGAFTILSIIISTMGIFAMSLYYIQLRIKEIGIRKVNGAKVWEVMAMLNFDFVKWVIIAFVAATPIAWYSMNSWLQNFAYRTELRWWMFAMAGMLALAVAILTVSWQSWQAARRNPVEALRYE